MILLLALLLVQSPLPAPAPQEQGRDTSAKAKASAGISGRILTADGRPLRRAQISVRAPELRDARTTSTNALGRYELRDLPPGRYTITVARSGYLTAQYGQRRFGEPGRPLRLADGQMVEKVDVTLARAGVISGRITDETGDALSGVSVFPMQVQYFRGRRRLVSTAGASRTDDTGQYRLLALPPGEYIVMASLRETWVSDGERTQVLAYVPSYFPGASGASDAQRVKVATAQEVPGIDFSMVVGKAARVSGTAAGSDGTPLAGAELVLMHEVAGPGFSTMMMGGTSKVAADGTWVLRDVAPGEYLLEARGTERERSGGVAVIPLTVAGGDIEGVALVVDPGGAVSGQVVTHDGAPVPQQVLTGRVMALSVLADRRGRGVDLGDENGRLATDGTFTLGGISGPSLLSLSSLPRGWTVKSIDIAGRDHADVPVEVRAGQRIEGAKILITNQFPILVATITDDKGEPADATLILFPEDSTKWLEGTGSVRSGRPDQAGEVRIEGVRPGEYLAAAVDYVQRWQVLDPEFLEGLRSDATQVTLREGEAPRLTLRIRKP